MRFDLLKHDIISCDWYYPEQKSAKKRDLNSRMEFRKKSNLFRSHPTLLKKFPLYSLFSLVLAAHVGYFEPWGKDADLKVPQEISSSKERSLATEIAQLVIRFHQEVISPVDGPRSHYRPSSSQYMQQAMDQYGFFKGFIMGCDRLLRENDEEWVYRKVQYDGKTYKYDPARVNKYE